MPVTPPSCQHVYFVNGNGEAFSCYTSYGYASLMSKIVCMGNNF